MFQLTIRIAASAWSDNDDSVVLLKSLLEAELQRSERTALSFNKLFYGMINYQNI